MEMVQNSNQELSVEYFAGFGGVSQGFYQATGKHVDVAVNHSDDAISVHIVNHPTTKHFKESVWDVDPAALLAGKTVGMLWGSPDCTHHSKAAGGVPRNQNIRGLSWALLKFALIRRPRWFGMENVEEIMSWGPLVNGKPCKERAGETFDGFVRAWQGGITPKHGAWQEMIRTVGIEFDIKSKLKLFKGLGYKLDHALLRMSDYGIPTTRKRFVLIARCDGQPLVWPEITHANYKLKKNHTKAVTQKLEPYRQAAECIDWSIKCKSLLGRKKLPVTKSLQRIVKGLDRFVFKEEQPFVIPRGKNIKLIPFITEHANASSQRNFAVDEPLRTQCASVKGGHFALIQPTFVRNSEEGLEQSSIMLSPMQKHYGDTCREPGLSMEGPVSTIATVGHNALLTSHIIKYKGKNIGHSTSDPLQTVTSGGLHFGEVRSLLLKLPSDRSTNQCDKFNRIGEFIEGRELSEDERYSAWWIARLIEEYSGEISEVPDHLRNIPRERKMYIEVDSWVMVDVGTRMLTPRELARAHDFPDSYVLEYGARGEKMSIAKQVKGIGNSVPPTMVELIIRANLPELCSGNSSHQHAA